MSFLLKSDIKEICENIKYFRADFEGKTILITGASGFLGVYFLETFLLLNKNLKKPCKIIAVDNFLASEDILKNFGSTENIKFIKHDINEPFQYDERIDYIINLAGLANPYFYKKFPLETIRVSTIGTENILKLALKNDGCKVMMFSSSEVYGDPLKIPTTEDTPCQALPLGDRGVYDNGKIILETICKVYHQMGVHVVIIRPFNVYGPNSNKYDFRVIPNFLTKIISNKHVSIYDSGQHTRTFCYVVDGIIGFTKALCKGKSGEAYNIGNPSPEISMLNLAKTMEKTLKIPVKKELISYPSDYPSSQPNRRCPDISKAQKELNYQPQISLEEGLKRFYGWAKENYTKE
jgi:UDP-glucuronate decarboxylase